MHLPHPPLLVAQFEAAATRLARLVEPWDADLAAQARGQIPQLTAHFEKRAIRTAHYYSTVLNHWVDWLERLPLNGPPTSPAVLEAYFHWTANEGSKPSYQRLRTSLLRTMLETLGLLDEPARYALQRIGRANPKDPSRAPPKALPGDFLQRLESTTDLSDPVQLADTALLILLGETLIRPQAILGFCSFGSWSTHPVEVADLLERPDGTGRLKLRPLGYGRSTDAESVAVSHLAMKWLKLWLRHLRGSPGPLFRTARGRPLTVQSLPTTLMRVGQRTGLRRRVSVVALRRLTASHMLAAGVDVTHIDAAFRAHGMSERSWLPPRHASTARTPDHTLRDFARRRRCNSGTPGDCPPPQLTLFTF